MKFAFTSACLMALLSGASATADESNEVRRHAVPEFRDLAANSTFTSPLPETKACWKIYKNTYLTGDYYCDCDKFAPKRPSAVIEVVGPAFLHLNGYKVKCSSGYTTVGTIVASGEGAKIGGGYVYGSEDDEGDCIHLQDAGYHGVKEVVVYGCPHAAITSGKETSYNKIVKSYTSYSYYGIVASGNGDSVKHNHVYHAEDGGILAYGSYVHLNGNYVDDAGYGIGVFNVGDEIFYNTVTNSPYSGIFVHKSATEGEVRANTVRANTVSHSGEDGMVVEGSNNLIRNNVLYSNVYDGIRVVEPAMGNDLTKNLAYDNNVGKAPWQYFNYGTGCGTNEWTENQGYGNLKCID